MLIDVGSPAAIPIIGIVSSVAVLFLLGIITIMCLCGDDDEYEDYGEYFVCPVIFISHASRPVLNSPSC